MTTLSQSGNTVAFNELPIVGTALATEHRDYILHNAMRTKPGDALSLRVLPRLWNDRRCAVRNCALLIKRLVTSCRIEVLHDTTSRVLYAGMGSALELYVLEHAQSRALEEHGTTVTLSQLKAEYIKDLNKIKSEVRMAQDNGYDGTKLCPAGFREMLSPWLDKAETICHPDFMKIDSDDEPFAYLESPWSEYYPDPDAMVVQMPTRGDLRHVWIKPLETATSKFLNIHESFRGDTFEDLLNATIKVNGDVNRSRLKDHLSADELLPFAQKLESGVLEAMHDELFGEDDRPSPVEIKARYWKRMEKKIKEDCGILANFVKLVKVFHHKFRNVLKNVGRGMKKFGHGIKGSLRNLKVKDRKARARASEPMGTEAGTSEMADGEPTTTEPLPRQQFLQKLVDTLSNMNASMSAEHNNGNVINSPEELQQMAEWLEALMWKDLEAKFKDQPIGPEQSLAEYVAAGLQLLAKISTQEVYLPLIRECFGIGT
ncbi:hypothetical protein HBI56_114210 [Parastagonospora nodorum]|nr:hypothetical protein HBH51_030730 [Parastagonospora nodorum]KAH4036500.1 hypothetical protein HBI09_073660 [Parastagonospora nodorum]KAH4052095.1 hypothetical protein HBH49_111980 [Parastagonospora nodorum]KAH4068041.1 hypothetical protein HBH50_121740 [Parastagonospora nodorum]KAH4085724.1 hypothetical protein HBH48_153420 [Parastagonospora nodorum]